MFGSLNPQLIDNGDSATFTYSIMRTEFLAVITDVERIALL